MKIAIPSTEKDIETIADARFGRAKNFIIFDTNNNSYKSIDNKFSDAVSGAGGQVVRLLSEEKVEVVLLPEVGPKALEAIKTFELNAYRYSECLPVTEILRLFKSEELELVVKA